MLGSQPLTREQFAQAVAQETGSRELRELILAKGWGTPLKPLAWRGELCFGPSQGRNVTFVNPARWSAAGRPWSPTRRCLSWSAATCGSTARRSPKISRTGGMGGPA